MNDLLSYEKLYWEKDLLVLGIDEAGRGPLAGPLVIAAVCFPKNYYNDQINDSKKLSFKKREMLYEVIINDALYYDYIIVNPDEIDKLNIYQATKINMEKIAMRAEMKIILSDAMKLDLNKTNIAIIKGDQKSISIAAASIIAKTIRDRIMLEYDKQYPHYEFIKHKGYPTKKHLALIKKYGINNIYRKSYRPVMEIMNKEST